MTIGQSMLPEFDQEMQNTRKVLERVPRREVGLEAAREVRHCGMDGGTYRHNAGLDRHDPADGRTGLCASKRSVLPTTEN